jgi:hypothetical protein
VLRVPQQLLDETIRSNNPSQLGVCSFEKVAFPLRAFHHLGVVCPICAEYFMSCWLLAAGCASLLS